MLDILSDFVDKGINEEIIFLCILYKEEAKREN